jgi:biotin carboxylase
VWLTDADDPAARRVRPMLQRSGIVVDALGKPPAQAAQALRAHSPSGLATFYDTGMEHVAAIARELGLPFHSVQAARCLEDKLHQRDAFAAAGLPTPRHAALPESADRAAVEELGASVGYPAVLKPRRASGSWRTFPVPGGRALGELWDQLALAEREGMLLEQYLPDGPAMPGGFEADYVSVETVVASDRMHHLAITGRFPPEPPFRETGFFIPATLAPEQIPEVIDLAERALRAVGFAVGASHTEIKLTSEGPRVIEINGRIGGGVPEMLRLAAGVDIMKLTMQAALGTAIEVDQLPATRRVGYRFFYQPPASARRVGSIAGLDRLRDLPGVESVSLHYRPGSEIDARDGTRSYLFAVVGAAEDHRGVVAVADFMRAEIEAEYDRA